MDLEKNLIDNILECEVKLGHEKLPVSFYYPKESLYELLDCNEDTLEMAIADFKEKEVNRLGALSLEQTENDKDRYVATVPADGVEWVSNNYTASDFMLEFIKEVSKPQSTLDSIVSVFKKYSDKVLVKQMSEDEWAVSFLDEAVDPYVYHIEQNDFGLEYHRFTHLSYQKTIL